VTWSVSVSGPVDWSGPSGGTLTAGQSKPFTLSSTAADNPVRVTVAVSGHSVTITAELILPG
jgi:hypothetical protein